MFILLEWIDKLYVASILLSRLSAAVQATFP
jgi:hypothetical protein